MSPILGLVMALKANYYEVEIDIENLKLSVPSINKHSRFLCTSRSRLIHNGYSVNVGDRVWIDSIDWQLQRAVVTSVVPRKNLLVRPPVANVTEVVVALSLKEPAFVVDQACRFLLMAEHTHVNVHLLLTKIDLISSVYLAEQLFRFSKWGYKPLAISVKTGEGLDDLRELFSAANKLIVICGPSGVGKSSLLNTLESSISLKVGSLSRRLQRGRHTTRDVQLFPIGNGSLIADTPGFNRADLQCEAMRLPMLFPEVRNQLMDRMCKFRDCLHREEPGCIINKDWERYPLYRSYIDELN